MASGNILRDSERKKAIATRINEPPVIDGIGNDPAWQNLETLNNFRQYLPLYDQKTKFETNVKIAFDDYAIYVLAIMYDPNPDSILHQLGLRDQQYLNTDFFTIAFDTYNNQSDAFIFSVSASGVQFDSRISDDTYNAVWQSSARINETGWVTEIKIPYSALRFASKHPQEWGLQLSRNIRRYRERDIWAQEIPEAKNNLFNWGILTGLDQIKPPFRLSATPYCILQAEHFPDVATKKDISSSFGGGMDLKLGINEGYTLDMSLLPDFSQVQSDNKVKNLTAFETVYEEQRPFFNEAVDLFDKGSIFYSRRIGKSPTLFYTVSDSLKDGEQLLKNPVQQKLINSIKLSGRNKNGFAIGLLNAVTARTYATLSDQDHQTRKILTDPFTNYNLIVLDQTFSNNSDIFIINTNVFRDSGYDKANVSVAGTTLNDKSNTYRLTVSGGMSQKYSKHEPDSVSTTKGFKYDVSLQKVSGNFVWSLVRSALDKRFDANDMGVTLYNNYNNNQVSAGYNIYKPFGAFRDMMNTIQLTMQNNFTTHKPQNSKIKYSSVITTKNYLNLWFDAGYLYQETYDYYEPRTEGRFYMKPRSAWIYLGYSSDYRKPLALDGSFSVYRSKRDKSNGWEVSFSPLMRINDHLSLTLSTRYEQNLNDFGYVNTMNENIYFGKRNINTVENSINGNYLFRNNISLSLTARHYSSVGEYSQYYLLTNDGGVNADFDYAKDHNFNYNTFNIDMIFSWIFMPGSSLSLAWKNETLHEESIIRKNYFENLDRTLENPQRNNISLKILYYIDYQNITKKKK